MTPFDITTIRFSAAVGTASFPMTKGSFVYDDTHLKTTRPALTDAGQGLFADPEGNRFTVVSEPMEDGLRIRLSAADPPWNRFYLTLPVAEGGHYYGCGETFPAWDLAGQRVRIWVAEHQSAARIERKMQRQAEEGVDPDRSFPFEDYETYYAQPTLTCAWEQPEADRMWIHIDTDRFCAFDLTQPGEITLEVWEPCAIELHYASDFVTLSAQMAERFGHVPPLPDWVHEGVILGIQRGTKEVNHKLSACEAAGVPVVGVWCQDWCGCRKTAFGYQVMWNWQSDDTLYPDMKQQIQIWHIRGVRVLGYINPFLAIEGPLYKEASALGYLVKDAAGADYLVTITTFPAAMIDLTNPDAWNWYKKVIQTNMLDIGMDGWMADFGEYLPIDAVLYSGEDAAAVHNRWPALWAKLNREAIEEAGRLGEVLFFTRAGSAGTIAASTLMWTGDQHVDWSKDDGLPSVIPATLSLGMSGYPFAHSDFGGYTTNDQMQRSRELLMRWEEMNVFSPLMRGHEGNRPWANVQFDADEELLHHLALCGSLHAAFGPYLKRLVKEASEHGTPVMRPLCYHYEEPRAYTEAFEYLLGPDILVAPVLLPEQTTRTVWLPKDEWVHLFTWEHYHGGEVTVPAPLGQPPVFMRVGSDALGVGPKLASRK